MDDQLKIRALMTYYEHWGNEQNKALKALDGARRFRKLFEKNRFLFSATCRSYLRRHNRHFCYDLLDVLLNECGGGFKPNDTFPDDWDTTAMLMVRRLKFIDNHNYKSINFYDAIDPHFTAKDALNVDAIIALF